MRAWVDFPGEGGARLRIRLERAARVLAARAPADVPGVLAEAHDRARAGSWVAGFVAYEAAPVFDRALAAHAHDGPLPLAWFAVFDASPADLAEAPPGQVASGPWEWLTDARQARQDIEAIRAGIARGDYYQVNLTTRLRAPAPVDPWRFFDALRAAQPGGYGIALDGGDWQVLSVSPELFFDWTPEGVLCTQPMKGTAARDADPARDREARDRMLASEKERAENLMIVDLLRNDLGRIALTGSVQVTGLFQPVALPTAWQMVSTVRCRTPAGLALPGVFGALFPCGSVTGAPKVAAMREIHARERAPRGAYCGAIGVLRPGGHATFNVGIRTVTVDARRGRAECGVGSGIVMDSDADAEYAEWRIKQRFLERAGARSTAG